ncbi:MAG: hypothetical protein GEU98_16005 [Pseudonocardiaceae bacterium]|nr:hypothetical protein [Pseudonocardiaceae bacterium]
MPKYIGFARDAHDWESMTEAEIQQAMERYVEWSEELKRAGHAVDGGPVGDDVKVLRREAELMVADGPYVESKEVLGGVAIVEAADLDEAVRLFGTHPHLEFGSIEVRELGEL